MKHTFAYTALGLGANALVAHGYAISSQPTETPCETIASPSNPVSTVAVPSVPVETPCEETTTFVTSKHVVTSSVVTIKAPAASSKSYAVVPSSKPEEIPYETIIISSSKPSETPCETIVVPSSTHSKTPYETIVVPSSKPASSKPVVSSSQPPKPITSSAQPSKPSTTQSVPKPSSTTPTTPSACPADLKGNYEYPHLIVPIDSKQPNKSHGTSYSGTINSTTCTIFNFDIPASYSGKTCTLTFLFPLQSQLETSSFTFPGQGTIDFSKLSGPATEETTHANQPHTLGNLASLSVAPGNSYSIASSTCAAGQRIAYKLCGTEDLSLRYFQDYNPSPIGLYIRQC